MSGSIEMKQPRLLAHYRNNVVPALMQELSLGNVMQVPCVQKITLNVGVGEAVNDKKVLGHVIADLEKITGSGHCPSKKINCWL